jgi:hypothetical protein
MLHPVHPRNCPVYTRPLTSLRIGSLSQRETFSLVRNSPLRVIVDSWFTQVIVSFPDGGLFGIMVREHEFALSYFSTDLPNPERSDIMVIMHYCNITSNTYTVLNIEFVIIIISSHDVIIP